MFNFGLATGSPEHFLVYFALDIPGCSVLCFFTEKQWPINNCRHITGERRLPGNLRFPVAEAAYKDKALAR